MYPTQSKAEMLGSLAAQGFPVPPLTWFSVSEWDVRPDVILAKIAAGPAAHSRFLAVRSSARAEDGVESSLAGAFTSLLNVDGRNSAELGAAIGEVRAGLSGPDDQIIAQVMAERVIMCGVLMTRALDDGSPYYVLNYDDVSGRTDTVTSGRGVSKTVHIHRGVQATDFDSPRLAAVVELARSLEAVFGEEPLDVEFAVDADFIVHLLQVRRICAARHWRAGVERGVNERIAHVAAFVEHLMTPRRGLFGRRSILGVMPDWNPAEMIGMHPKPLALSLYRELITRRTWSQARELMGYRPLPPVELMVTVGGRPYIDARASFNSFLPAGLPDAASERLTDAWLDRLDRNPAYHDKVEFEIVNTVVEPDFEDIFRARYGHLLSPSELVEYRVRLTDLTARAVQSGGSLDRALAEIEKLRLIQEAALAPERRGAETLGEFDLALRLAEALEQCRTLGTLPFAVAARHGFIAETWLRAAGRRGVLAPDRAAALRRSIKTVSGELTRDFNLVLAGRMPRADFLNLYGHLRPGAYDLLSASYRERADLFEVDFQDERPVPEEHHFQFSPAESRGLEGLLTESALGLTAEAFLQYVRRAVAGREYAKFIFSRHLDHILFLAAAWGRRQGFSREETAFLSVEDILASTFQPLPMEGREYFRERLAAQVRDHELGRSFKLSYLLRSPRDVLIVPQHRSEPNFIGSGRVEAPVLNLGLHPEGAPIPPEVIVCIESADPGYDWIFTRRIAGLVTRYGGTNSHMAIRCAEYGLPAAIGCGELIYEAASRAARLRLDCADKAVTPLEGFPGAPAADLTERPMPLQAAQ